MANFNAATLTKKGIGLLAKAQAGQTAIAFTKAAAGCGSYEEGEDLTEKEALKDQRQEFPFDKLSVVNGSTVSMKFTITNNQESGLLQEGYHVKEVGVFAEDPDEGEILYAIATAVENQWDYMPAYSSLMPAYITVEFYAEVSNASEVTIVCSGRFVTAEEMEAELEAIRELIAGFNSKFITAETAGIQHNAIIDLIGELGEVPEGVLTAEDKGVAGGVPSLDSQGRIPSGQLPYDSGAVYLGEKLALQDFTWRAVEGGGGWVGTRGPDSSVSERLYDLTDGRWSKLLIVPDLDRLYNMYVEKVVERRISVFSGLHFTAFVKVGANGVGFEWRIFSDENLGQSEAADVAFWPYFVRRDNPSF